MLPRTDLWGTDDAVYGVARLGSTLFFTGSFTQVGPVTGSFAVADANAQAIPAFPQIEGTVTAMAPDGSGGAFVVGDFAYVAGQSRNGAAHIRADGSLDPWNPSAVADVRSVAVLGNTVYFGGAGLLAVDATLGYPLGINFALQGYANALAVSGNRLYVAGSFTSLLGASRQSLAAINATDNTLEPWTAPVVGSVSAVGLGSGNLYLGGTFTQVGGQPRTNVAAVSQTTGAPTSFSPSTDGTVYALMLSGSSLYLGGHFSHMGNQPRAGAGAVDVSTGAILPWSPATGNAGNAPVVKAIAPGPHGIAIGGEFTTMAGADRPGLAEVDASTGALTTWNPRPAAGANVTARVFSMLPIPAGLALGGSFTVVGGQQRSGAAAIDLATGALLPWTPLLVPPPGQRLFGFAIRADSQRVFVSGQFTNGLPVLLAFDPVVGAADPNFVAFSQAMVHQEQMALQNGVLYLNCSSGCLCALDAVSGDLIWCSPQSEIIRALAPSQDLQAVFLSRDHSITAVAMSDGTALPWVIPANAQINTLQLSGHRLYAGGGFQQLGNLDRQGLGAIDFPTLMDPVMASWNPGLLGSWLSLTSMALRSPALYLSGSFNSIGGQPRTNVGSMNLDSTAACTWNPDGGGGLLAAFDDSLVMFGGSLRISHRLFEGLAVFPFHVCIGDANGDCQLNVNDFVAFQNLFAAGASAANCDQSTIPPVLNVNDFACFVNRFAAGCP